METAEKFRAACKALCATIARESALNLTSALAAILLVASCTAEEPFAPMAEKTGTIVFNSVFAEEASKATLGEDGKLRWQPGDKIKVFDGQTSETVALTSDNIINDGKGAVFSTSALDPDADFYTAAYPADAFGDFPQSGNPKLELNSSVFRAVAKTTAEDSFTFYFRNCGALIIIEAGDEAIHSVELTANDETPLITDAEVYAASALIEHPGSASVCTLRQEVGQDGKAVLQVNPCRLACGYTLKAYDSEGRLMGRYTTDKAIKLERSKYYTVKDLAAKISDYLSFTAGSKEVEMTLLPSWGILPDPLPSVEYSFDRENWEPLQISLEPAPVKIPAKKTVYLRGRNTSFSTESAPLTFSFTEDVSARGNIMTLLDPSGRQSEIPSAYCFQYLFLMCGSLLTPPALPATVLKPYCYNGMFYMCAALASTPSLPAKNLETGCYNRMFYNLDTCEGINSIDAGFTSFADGSCTNDWLFNAASGGTYTVPEGFESFEAGASTFPEGWAGESRAAAKDTVGCVELDRATGWEILRMDESTWDIVDRSLYEFKTKEPVRVQLSKDKSCWWITNYTPMAISDVCVEEYFPEAAQYVKVAHLDTIPAYTRLEFHPDYYGKKTIASGAEMQLQGPSASERLRITSTDPFWRKLQKIEADWTGYFDNYNITPGNTSSWYEEITGYYAREWMVILTNYAYMMSTPEYDHIMANFKDIFGEDLFTDAGVVWDEKMYQTEKARFKAPFTFYLEVVKSSYAGGLGGSAGWFGVAHWNFYGHYYSYSGWEMVAHESMHCWKYGHDSNMTYSQRGIGWTPMIWQLHIWLAKKGELPYTDPTLTGFTSAENAPYRYGGIDGGYNFTKRDQFYAGSALVKYLKENGF